MKGTSKNDNPDSGNTTERYFDYVLKKTIKG
jgi:hypothetical protein